MRGSFLSSSGSKSDPDVARFKKIVKEINKVITSFPLTNTKLNVIEPAMKDFENYGNSFLNARSQNDLQLFYVGWDKFCKEFKEIIEKDYFDLIKKFLFEQLNNTTTIMNEMISNHSKDSAQINRAINEEEALREELYKKTKVLRKTIFGSGKINLQELSIIYHQFQQYRNEIQRTFKIIFTSANISDLEMQSSISKVQMFMSKCCACLSDSTQKDSRLISYVNYWTPEFHSQALYEKYKTWKTEINRIFGEPLTYKGKSIKVESERPKRQKRKTNESDSATMAESSPPNRNDDYIERLLAEIKRLTEENEMLRKQLEEVERQYKKLYGKLDATRDDIKNTMNLRNKLEQSILELQQAKAAKKRIEDDNRQLKASLSAAGACLKGKEFKQAAELVSLRKERDDALNEAERLKKNLLTEKQTSRNALIQGGLDGLSGFASNSTMNMNTGSFELNPDNDPDALFDMYKTALAENDIRRQTEEDALKKLGDFERLKSQKAQLKLDVKELRRQLSEIQAHANREDPSEDIMRQLQLMSQQILGSQKSADALTDENSKLKIENTQLKHKLDNALKKASQESDQRAELENEIEKLNKQIENARKKAGQEVNEEIEKLNNKVEDLKKKKHGIEEDLNKTSKENTKLQAKLEESEKTIARLAEEAKNGSNNEKTANQLKIILDQRTSEFEKEKQKASQLETEVKRLKTELTSSTSETERQKKKKKDVKEELNEVKGQLNDTSKKSTDKIKELNEKLENVKEKKRNLKINLSNSQTEITRIKGELKKAQDKLNDAENTISILNEEAENGKSHEKTASQLQALLDKEKRQNAELKQQLTDSKNNISKLADEIEEKDESIGEMNDKIKKLNKQLDSEKQNNSENQTKIEQMEEDLKEKAKEINKLTKQLESSKQSTNEKQSRIEQLEEDLKEKTKEINKLTKQVESEKQRADDNQTKIDKLKKDIKAKDNTINDLNNKINILNATVENLKNTARSLQDENLNLQSSYDIAKEKADNFDDVVGTMNAQLKTRDAFVKLKDDFNNTTNEIIVYEGEGIDREKIPSILENLNKKHERMLSKYNQLVWPRVYREAAALVQVNASQKILIERMKESSDKLFEMYNEANGELVKLRAQGVADKGGSAEEEAAARAKELGRFKKDIEGALSKSEASVGIKKAKGGIKERIEALSEFINERLRESKLVDDLKMVPEDIYAYKKEIEEENKKYSLIEKDDNEKSKIKVSTKEESSESEPESDSDTGSDSNENPSDSDSDDESDSSEDDDDDDE